MHKTRGALYQASMAISYTLEKKVNTQLWGVAHREFRRRPALESARGEHRWQINV